MWGDRAEVEGHPKGLEVTQGPGQVALNWRQPSMGVTAGAGAGGHRELTSSWQHPRKREQERHGGGGPLSQGVAFG